MVDISADFRYSTDAAYAAVYKHAHGAPARLPQFSCAVPEHLAQATTPHIAHLRTVLPALLAAPVRMIFLKNVEPAAA